MRQRTVASSGATADVDVDVDVECHAISFRRAAPVAR